MVETISIFCLNLDAENQRCFIPFASTQLKKARRWLTLATSEIVQDSKGNDFTPPLFYRSYVLGAAKESNAKGDWFGWSIERGEAVPELENWKQLLSLSTTFKRSLESGEAKADVSQMDETQPSEKEEAFLNYTLLQA